MEKAVVELACEWFNTLAKKLHRDYALNIKSIRRNNVLVAIDFLHNDYQLHLRRNSEEDNLVLSLREKTQAPNMGLANWLLRKDDLLKRKAFSRSAEVNWDRDPFMRQVVGEIKRELSILLAPSGN